MEWGLTRAVCLCALARHGPCECRSAVCRCTLPVEASGRRQPSPLSVGLESAPAALRSSHIIAPLKASSAAMASIAQLIGWDPATHSALVRPPAPPSLPHSDTRSTRPVRRTQDPTAALAHAKPDGELGQTRMSDCGEVDRLPAADFPRLADDAKDLETDLRTAYARALAHKEQQEHAQDAACALPSRRPDHAPVADLALSHSYNSFARSPRTRERIRPPARPGRGTDGTTSGKPSQLLTRICSKRNPG